MDSFVANFKGTEITVTQQLDGTWLVKFENGTTRIINVDLDPDQNPFWSFSDEKDGDLAGDIGEIIDSYLA